ncbi:hypothetical protein [uncultured Pseudokineococcus sp.]|uniref:hypothetical protein n=1 Tax=uncultured Pseudokineococcus sp. TaxID=1642928 RepID=UPI002632C1CC|nr:hypothetical protein [uncultured Pseudokineococcus sp.]
MEDTGGCGCAREYAARYPGMTEGELALVHAPVCPVRLQRLEGRRRRDERRRPGR